MARKLRLQYEGAVYHVISRGNYRAQVFAQNATKAAFLSCLQAYLDGLRKTPTDIVGNQKGVGWKVALAAAMKTHSTASNPWLAEHLNMGSPFRLSRLVSECRRTPTRFSPYVDRIAKCKV